MVIFLDIFKLSYTFFRKRFKNNKGKNIKGYINRAENTKGPIVLITFK